MSRRGDGDSQGEDDPGKIFIGGLTWDTEDSHLQNYFCKWGEITDSHVMIDNRTMKSRCFGFVTFKDPASAVACLAEGPHSVMNKKVDAKICNKKAAAAERQSKRGGPGDKIRKVFIGGLPATCDEEVLKDFFKDFGEVTESVIVIDPTTQRPRGFGFITFADSEPVDKVCKLHFHNLQGKQIECKEAQPRQPGMGRSAGGQDQQGGGGAGGNWGMQNQGGFGGAPNQWAQPQQNFGGYMDPYAQQQQQYGQQAYGQQAYGQQAYGQQAAYGQQPQYGQQPGYDYSNMGGGYAQQQSNFGPDRGGYQAAAAQPYSGYSGYSTDTTAAYSGAQTGYPQADASAYNAAGAGAQQRYNPYGR